MSHLCKITEQIITERLTYVLETGDLLTPYQSGFQRGRSMDCYSQSDMRNAQAKKAYVIERITH